MPRLNYLAQLDAIHYYQTYRPIIADMTRDQLEIVLLLILNGEPVETAFDHGMAVGWTEHPIRQR